MLGCLQKWEQHPERNDQYSNRNVEFRILINC